MAEKCACERAKEKWDDTIKNPVEDEVGSGRLRDAMEAEMHYFAVWSRCTCRLKARSADANSSLITEIDSDEEREEEERNVETENEEEATEPARGEKCARSDDEEEQPASKRL